MLEAFGAPTCGGGFAPVHTNVMAARAAMTEWGAG
jgi:hypothetical protein